MKVKENTNYSDHKNNCRLCINAHQFGEQKFEIIEEVRRIIFSDLKIQVCFICFSLGSFLHSLLISQLILTGCYSNFICQSCHNNLKQLSSFRTSILEKQHQLSRYLCRVLDNHDLMPKNVDDPLNLVLIKTEFLEEEFFSKK